MSPIADLLNAFYDIHIFAPPTTAAGTVVERRSLTGELSLSCARPAADG